MPRANTYQTNWSDEDVESVRKGIADGLSAQQIAHSIEYRHSRNAVIGKCLRLGLHLNGRWPTKERAPVVTVAEIAYRKERDLIRRQVARTMEKIETKDFLCVVGHVPDPRSQQCVYVVGQPSALKACGHPTSRNKRGKMTPYCDPHRAVMYAPTPMKATGEPNNAVLSTQV